MPDYIDILGVRFHVREVPVVDKIEPCKGKIDFLSCEILIDESMPKDLKAQTLLHEVMHAVCDLTGNYEIGEDENAVQSLATGLHCVLKSNSIMKMYNRREKR